MKLSNRWPLFVKERFSPLSYSVMILFFFASHFVLYLRLVGDNSYVDIFNLLSLLPLILALFVFFFLLRLFDEVKDLRHDTLYNPERPLPRGDLTMTEVFHVLFALLLLELAIFLYYGLWSLLGGIGVVVYTLLMYKEFFVSEWLRSRLTTYAVTHTFVIVLVSVTVFTILLNVPPFEIPADFLYFSFANWFIFSLFEFGRKTFVSSEERVGVNSYSKTFNRSGAVLLVLLTATSSVILVGQVVSLFGFKVMSLSLLVLAFFGFLYALYDQVILARTFRFLTTSYIIFIYGIILVT